MILSCSVLKVCDNSNVVSVKCFNLYKKFKLFIGCFLYLSVKNVKYKGILQKGNVCKGILVRKKKKINRKTGNGLCFNSNDIVVLNIKNEALGTRIFGLMPLELRRKKFLKILSISSNFI